MDYNNECTTNYNELQLIVHFSHVINMYQILHLKSQSPVWPLQNCNSIM